MFSRFPLYDTDARIRILFFTRNELTTFALLVGTRGYLLLNKPLGRRVGKTEALRLRCSVVDMMPLGCKCEAVAVRGAGGIRCARCWRCTKPSRASAFLCVARTRVCYRHASALLVVSLRLSARYLISPFWDTLFVGLLSGFLFLFVVFFFSMLSLDACRCLQYLTFSCQADPTYWLGNRVYFWACMSALSWLRPDRYSDIRSHNESAIDPSSANPSLARGHKDVRRSTVTSL